MHTGFWCGNLSEGEHLEDRGVDVRIILKWILDKWDGGMDWIDFALDRPVLVNAVMNLPIS